MSSTSALKEEEKALQEDESIPVIGVGSSAPISRPFKSIRGRAGSKKATTSRYFTKVSSRLFLSLIVYANSHSHPQRLLISFDNHRIWLIRIRVQTIRAQALVSTGGANFDSVETPTKIVWSCSLYRGKGNDGRETSPACWATIATPKEDLMTLPIATGLLVVVAGTEVGRRCPVN